jgi:hypothetical protein
VEATSITAIRDTRIIPYKNRIKHIIMTPRRRFTNKDKLDVLSDVRVRARDTPLTLLAAEHGVHVKQLRSWIKNEALIQSAPPFATSLNQGRPSCIEDDVSEAVLTWMFEKRELGLGMPNMIAVFL